MKPIQLLTTTVVLLATQIAFAALDWNSIKGQDSWQKIQLESQIEDDVMATAFQVSPQEVRLEELPAEVTREITLTSNNDFNDSGFKRWKRECQIVDDYTPYIITTNNHFEMEVDLNLLRYDPRVWGVAGGKQLVKILNQPELNSLDLGIELTADAVSRKVRNQSPDVATNLLNQQLQQKMKATQPGGLEKLTFDLSGLDAIACDLANGNAEIKIRAHYGYESAKAIPDILISASDIERLHESARLRAQVGTSRDERVASTSAILLQTLQTQWPRLSPEDHLQKTIQLFPGLIDTKSVEWRTKLARQDYVLMMHKISMWNFSRRTGFTDYRIKMK